MCGIGGCYKKDNIQEEDVHNILAMARRSVERGRDATGFMIPNGWWKIAQASPYAVENSGLADWLEQNNVWDGYHKWMMFHTRAKTRGSERVSSNNHPMVHGREQDAGIKLIHNGFIKRPNYFSYSVVDTRSLAYLLNRLRKEGMSLLQATRSAIANMEGRAAIVVADRYGEEFVVMKDANKGRTPLFYYWNKLQDRMQFSSTKRIAGDSIIGSVGKKRGNVISYELDDWQALWWNGQHDTPLVRIWHKEKHGGDPLKMRLPLPPKLNLDKFKPKTFQEGGKFALNYYYVRPQAKTVRTSYEPTPSLYKPQTADIAEDVEEEYIEVVDIHMDDPVVSNIVIYPRFMPVIDDQRDNEWYGFTDTNWALSLRAALTRLKDTGEFVSIIRHDENTHTMYVLLSNNLTRKYFRSKRKGKLAYIDMRVGI